MGKHKESKTLPTAQHERWGSGDARPVSRPYERHVRASWSLPLFASVVSLAFVLLAATDHSPVMALGASSPGSAATPAGALAVQHEPQAITTTEQSAVIAVERAQWKTSRVITYGTAPAAGTPDPGTAMAIALTMVTARGWGAAEYDCLVALWNKESHWNVYAHNASSGAYGIPQALPGTKMATAGADWATNPATQITWGLGYIAARYATPCGAWAQSQRVGWY